VWFQADLIGVATLNDRGEFIVALLDLEPAILRHQPPPQSQAIEFAFTYTGMNHSAFATREQLKVFQDRGVVIVVINRDDLAAVAPGANLIRVLREKYEAVRLDLRGSSHAG